MKNAELSELDNFVPLQAEFYGCNISLDKVSKNIYSFLITHPKDEINSKVLMHAFEEFMPECAQYKFVKISDGFWIQGLDIPEDEGSTD